MDQYVLAYQYIPIRTGKTTNDFQRNDSLFRRLHRVGLRERERETHRLRPRGMGITAWSTRMGRLGTMNAVSAPSLPVSSCSSTPLRSRVHTYSILPRLSGYLCQKGEHIPPEADGYLVCRFLTRQELAKECDRSSRADIIPKANRRRSAHPESAGRS